MLMTLGEQVRSLRRRKNWTQADLADLMNRSIYWVHRLERGRARVSFEELGELARLLGPLTLPPPPPSDVREVPTDPVEK